MDKEAPLRVLHVADMNRKSGVSSMLMNFYRHMDREKIQFDFAVFRQDEENYADEIEAMGGRVCVLPLATSPLAFARAFGPLVKQYRIVHVHDMVASVEALWIARREGVQARVMHSHNNSIDTWAKKAIVRLNRPLLRTLSTHLYCTSIDAGAFLFGEKAWDSLIVLQNAIDPSLYRFDGEEREKTRAALGIADSFVLGHVGRFSAQKNHLFLLNIVAKVREKNPNTKLLLVGEGELELEIQELAKKLDIQDAIIFSGLQRDVRPFLLSMDVFVFPSLFEGFGLALLEAQASGLFCVASEKVIPNEADITGNVRFLPLASGPEAWAEVILQRPVISRESALLLARYDLSVQSQALATQYLKMRK